MTPSTDVVSLSLAGPVRCVSHRGDPRRHRENTLLGVASAITEGADVVEVDVKVTADGEVVLLHDLSLQRLWGHPGRVTDLSYADVADLTGGPLGVPRLRDALALLTGTPSALMIDLDAAGWAEPSVACVRSCIAEGLVTPGQVIWCGRDDSLLVVRELDDDARIVLSWDESNGGGKPPGDDIVDLLRPEAYNPHWPMVDADTVRWAHERELAVCCWTVDDEPTMRRLIDLGVTAMISNEIRTLRTVADELSG
ncbi:MAG: glycerophosphodiester phosphodiesterase [Propionibacteriaceae bacterium]